MRATALVLDGIVRRGDDPRFVPRLVRWLLAARQNGRWGNTQENATALEALVGYYKTFEAEIAEHDRDASPRADADRHGDVPRRSSTAQSVRLAMPDLLRQVAAGAEARARDQPRRHGPLYYSARLQFALTDAAARARSGHARRAPLRALRRERARARRRRRSPPAI